MCPSAPYVPPMSSSLSSVVHSVGTELVVWPQSPENHNPSIHGKHATLVVGHLQYPTDVQKFKTTHLVSCRAQTHNKLESCDKMTHDMLYVAVLVVQRSSLNYAHPRVNHPARLEGRQLNFHIYYALVWKGS